MTPPLHPLFRDERRRLLAATGALLAGLAAVSWATLERDFPALVAGLLVAVGVLVTVTLVASLRAMPEGFVLVADRHVPWPGRIHGEALARELVALDADSGSPAFSSFVSLALRAGAARHTPAELRQSAERVLASGAPLSAEARSGLQELTAALAKAETLGARCCLIPTGGWSGAIQTNLKLFFVTY